MHKKSGKQFALALAAIAAYPSFAWAQAYTREGGYQMPGSTPSGTGAALELNGFSLPRDSNSGGPETDYVWTPPDDDGFLMDGCGSAISFMPAGGGGGWFNPNYWTPVGVPNSVNDSATFNQPPDGLGDLTIDLNGNIALGTLTLNNSRGTDIIDIGGVGSTISNPGTFTVSSNRFFPELPTDSGKLIFGALYFGQRLQVNIAGGTTVITGAVPVWLTGNNSGLGNLIVRNGTVTVADFSSTALGSFQPPVINDNMFGQALTLDGGFVRLFSNLFTPSVMSMTKPITLGAGGGTFATTTSLGIVSGVISGTGDLWFVRGNTNTNLQAVNTYSGVTHVASGSITVGGAGGRLVNTSGLDINGTFTVANGGTGGSLDRINNAANVTMHGGILRVTSTATYAETFGNMNLLFGQNTVLMTAGTAAGADTTVNLGNMTRSGNAGFAASGRNVGVTNTGANQTTHLNIANGTSLLVGTGSGTSQPIIPWAAAISNNSTTPGTGGGLAALATYDANGFRPLTAAEHIVNSTAGATSDSNILVNQAAGTALGTATVGALAISSPSASATVPSGAVTAGTLTLSRGVLLSNAQGNNFNGNLTSTYTNGDGKQELIVSVHSDNSATAGLTVGGNIFGNIDFTKSGPGTYFPTGANTYTGKTRLTQGRTIITANVPASGASVFGNPSAGNEEIIVQSGGVNLAGGGALTTRLLNETGSLSIGRPVHVTSDGASGALLGSFGNFNTVWAGTFTVDAGAVAIFTGSNEFRGGLAGGGVIRDNGAGRTVFAGNNSAFTGQLLFNLPGGANTTVVIEPTAVEPFGTGTADIDDVMTFVAQGNVTSSANWVVTGAGLGTWSGAGNVTLNGQVDLGSFTSDIRVGSGVGTATAGKLTINGNLTNGNFVLHGVALAGGGSTDFTTGTLELGGNNAGLDNLLFLGESAVLAGTGSCTNAAVAEIPAGVLRLTSSTALGAEDVTINAEESTLQVTNSISLSADNDFFLAGDGVGSGTTALGSINSQSGNNSMGGDWILTDHVTVAGTINTAQTVRVDAGTLTHTGVIFDVTTGSAGIGTASPAGNSVAVLNKTGAGVLTLKRAAATDTVNTLPTNDTLIALGGLNIAGGTLNTGNTVKIALSATNNDPNSLSAVKSLTIGAGAKLDLGNNSMVVDYTGASPRAALEALITSGRAGGAWTGDGINSAAAAAGTPNKFAIGIAEVGDTAFSGSYLGLPIDTSAVIMRYTLAGDFNLSGGVTLADFTILSASFGTAGRWATGDTNYDGSVNLADFTALAANFGLTASDVASRGSAVPEPTTLGLAALAVTGLAARRRRA